MKETLQKRENITLSGPEKNKIYDTRKNIKVRGQLSLITMILED